MNRLAHTTIESPLGPLLLVASERGLLRVGLPHEEPAGLLDGLARRTGARARDDAAALAEAAEQVGEYFAGARRAFTTPLDLPAAPAFRRRALDELLRIPYGTTISYAELAARAGNGAAARAAGRACATNPLPVVVPCHRVVASDGSLNWYAGGLPSKELLLRLEGARPA